MGERAGDANPIERGRERVDAVLGVRVAGERSLLPRGGQGKNGAALGVAAEAASSPRPRWCWWWRSRRRGEAAAARLTPQATPANALSERPRDAARGARPPLHTSGALRRRPDSTRRPGSRNERGARKKNGGGGMPAPQWGWRRRKRSPYVRVLLLFPTCHARFRFGGAVRVCVLRHSSESRNAPRQCALSCFCFALSGQRVVADHWFLCFVCSLAFPQRHRCRR